MEHQGDQDYSATNGGGKLVKPTDLEDEHEEENNTNNKEVKVEVEEGVKSLERICMECNKRFSSGKALGGHISSAHSQKNKGQKNKSYYSKKLMKRKYNSKSAVGYDDDSIDEFDHEDVGYYYSESSIKKKRFGNICPHCGKDFPSNKSLFGHMRCHPDRPYRGMDPPDCNNHNDDDINHYSSTFSQVKCESGEVEEEGGRNHENCTSGNGVMGAGGALLAPVVDLTQDLVGRGWFKTGLRGVGSSATTAALVDKSGSDNEISDEDSEDEESSYDEFTEYADLLIHFYNSCGSKSNSVDDDEGEVAEMISSVATPMADDRMEVLLDFSMSRKSEQQSSNGEVEEVEAAGMVINQLKNKGKRKVILEHGDDTKSVDESQIVEEGKKRRKCNNSLKIVIKKEKLSQPSHELHVINSYSVVVGGAAPPPPPPPPPPSFPGSDAESGHKVYRCTYPSCGKTFATHQALGGHKSSHNKFKISIQNTRDDEILPPPPPPVVAMENNHDDDHKPASKGKRTYNRRNKEAVTEVQKVLDFDLNELPEGDYS